MGSFEISRAGIYPKYPEETVLFPVYATRQRNFGHYVTGVIFACKFFKFGLNTTGLSPSHFRKFSAGIINAEIFVPKLRSNQVPFFYNRVWNVHTGEMLNTLFHHCEAVLHLRFQDGMMVTCSKVTIKVRFCC